MLSDTIAQCKLALPMPELWQKLGLRGEPKKSCCSPFREDKEPSFSVFNVGKQWFYKDHATGESGDEISLIQRHSGCEKADAIKSYHELAGIEMQHKKNNATAKKSEFGKLIAIYNYTNAARQLLHQTLRYEPKRFLQRRPASAGMRAGNKQAKRDPTSGEWWIWTLEGIEPVLYQLPEILAEAQKRAGGKPVVLCEGEKDADAVQAHVTDVVATTAPMGAGKWRESYTQTLNGHDVIIAGHRDAAGRAHTKRVASLLKPVAKRLRIINWDLWPGAAHVIGKLDAAIFIAALTDCDAK